MARIHLIGMSDAGLESLSSRARGLVESARFIAGGKRHLEFVAHLAAAKLAVDGDLDGLAARLKQESAQAPEDAVVVLASGDPLFYGIGKALIERLGPGMLQVHPGLSSMQLAFARVGLSWEDASLVSVHGRSLAPLLGVPPTAVKLGVFTDDKNTPGIIATFLMAQGWPASWGRRADAAGGSWVPRTCEKATPAFSSTRPSESTRVRPPPPASRCQESSRKLPPSAPASPAQMASCRASR